MRAWILNTPASVDTRALLLGDVPTPHAAEDELLVRVSACGVCRTDLYVVEGELPVRLSPVNSGSPDHRARGGNGIKSHAIPTRSLRAKSETFNRTCGKCNYCLSSREIRQPTLRPVHGPVSGELVPGDIVILNARRSGPVQTPRGV